jgi:hypothetical protein
MSEKLFELIFNSQKFSFLIQAQIKIIFIASARFTKSHNLKLFHILLSKIHNSSDFHKYFEYRRLQLFQFSPDFNKSNHSTTIFNKSTLVKNFSGSKFLELSKIHFSTHFIIKFFAQ